MDILKVFSKDIETDKGGKFTTYYGYRQEFNAETGEYTDMGTPTFDADKNPIVISKPIKVKFSKAMYESIKGLHFPLIFKLDRDMKDKEGNSAFFVTTDKDKDGNARLDKNGKRHLCCVICSCIEVFPAPFEELTLDDLDTFK